MSKDNKESSGRNRSIRGFFCNNEPEDIQIDPISDKAKDLLLKQPKILKRAYESALIRLKSTHESFDALQSKAEKLISFQFLVVSLIISYLTTSDSTVMSSYFIKVILIVSSFLLLLLIFYTISRCFRSTDFYFEGFTPAKLLGDNVLNAMAAEDDKDTGLKYRELKLLNKAIQCNEDKIKKLSTCFNRSIQNTAIVLLLLLFSSALVIINDMQKVSCKKNCPETAPDKIIKVVF